MKTLLCGTMVNVKLLTRLCYTFHCVLCDQSIYTNEPNHCPKCYNFLKTEHDLQEKHNLPIDLV